MSPSSGSTIGTPIIPGPPPPIYRAWCQGALTLARYVELTNFPSCGFWGVAHEDEAGNSCHIIWTERERLELANYLCQAQEMIEAELGYPLGFRWFIEQNVPYTVPLLARWGHVVEAGIRAAKVVQADVPVNHLTDPAIIGPVATTVTNVNELKIYYPGTDLEIVPSKVVLSGGFVTFYVPRCRLVALENFDNPDVGWNYSDISVFEDTVDIYRIYNDPSVNAVLTTNHQCSFSCALQGCKEYTRAACIYITQPEIGAMEIYPATYDSGWRRTGNCVNGWMRVNLYYKAGTELDRLAENAIIRLAHSLMPSEPCGCDPVKALWKRDAHVPEVVTRERLSCPFGLSDGAWMAYMFAQSKRLVRGGLAV